MSNNKSEGLGTRLGFGVVYGACWLVGMLPRRFLFGPVAEVVYWLLYRVVHYRLDVVRDNLEHSFPERSADERRAIERAFYRNLAEYFIDAIDIAGITPRGRMRRCTWPEENRTEVMNQLAGRNWIALLSHYGSWELLGTYGLWPGASAMVSIYRPLTSRIFDLYYIKARNVPPRVNSVPTNETLRFLSAHRGGIDGTSLSLALLSDQNPPLDAQSRWVPFLNRPAIFFHGGEKIARKFAMPVYYMRVRKRGRGLWEQTFELVWDGTSPTADYEITGEYVRRLEEDIRHTPELWLWSHRRWKRHPEGDDAVEYEKTYGSH
jgi:KDO2-lipid IV(A) lauroyltransferase